MIFRAIVFLVLITVVSNVNAQLTYDNLIVQYDSAWTFKNLQLIPVRFKGPGTGATNLGRKNELISLQTAMLSNKAKVKEIIHQGGADVNWLEVTNTSKQTVVINSGSLLAGGKQDRIVAETKILKPGKKDYLKVFCIEKGRWDKKPKRFSYSGSSDPALKKVMDKTGRQQEVWKEVERQFATEKIPSSTYPYLKINRTSVKIDSDYLTYFKNKYKQSDSSYAGFLAITGNRIINCELFASADVTSMSFEPVIRGLITTAVTNGATPVVTKENMKIFLDKFLRDNESQKTFLTKHGKLDRFEGKVVHLIAYDD